MFELAPMKKLAGIIAAPDTYEINSFRARLLKVLRHFKGPVVTIRSDMVGFDSIYVDEDNAIRAMISHVIDDHGCTRLAFMAGYKGHFDGDRRLACFYDEMEKRGLPVAPNALFRGDMWRGKTKEAYSHYFENGKESIPQAIICANDYMAMALIAEIRAHGFSVPGDIIVTGFDNTPSAELNDPSLSTVGRSYTAMADAAVHLVDERIRGCAEGEDSRGIIARAVPTELVLRESCGCVFDAGKKHVLNTKQLAEQVGEISLCAQHQKYYLIESSRCTTLSEVRHQLENNVEHILNCKDFFVCLYTDEDQQREHSDELYISTKMSDRVRLFAAFRDGKPLKDADEIFDRTEILPSAVRSDTPQAFYIMIMHFGDKAFGYTAIRYTDGNTVDRTYHFWTVILASVLQNLYSSIMLKRISDENHLKSVTDALTGISNRRGFYEKLELVWDGLISEGCDAAFIETDLDGLKFINDNFGHNEGDRAIHVVGGAAVAAAPLGAICARTGGDEFLTFLPRAGKAEAEEYIKALRQKLKELNKMLKTAYIIDASSGAYVVRLCSGTDPSECVKQADTAMYIEKRRRKKEKQTD